MSYRVIGVNLWFGVRVCDWALLSYESWTILLLKPSFFSQKRTKALRQRAYEVKIQGINLGLKGSFV